MAYVYPVF